MTLSNATRLLRAAERVRLSGLLASALLVFVPEVALADPGWPTARSRAEACSERRDHACVISLLEGSGQTEVELWLLLLAYRGLERLEWIAIGRRYLAQYPDGPRAGQVQDWVTAATAPRVGDPGMIMRFSE